MLRSHQVKRASGARIVTLMLPVTAVLLTGCAENGLDTGALGLAPAQSPGSASQPATGDAAGWTATVARAKEPDFKVKPETAALIKEARALRKDGDKAGALALLDKAPGADTDLALVKERGLLAAELGKLDQAEKLLRKAHDPKAPDWRVYSALGATLSASGRQSEARVELTKALDLAPDHPAILNNLALSYAMEGKHEEAERSLRKAASLPGSDMPQPKQNLALVLGLKGDMEEARKVSAAVLPPEKAAANIAYLERLKTANTQVSRADPTSEQVIRAAVLSRDSDRPIMQLGVNPN